MKNDNKDQFEFLSKKAKENIILIVITLSLAVSLYKEFAVNIPTQKITKMLNNTNYIISVKNGKKINTPVKKSFFIINTNDDEIIIGPSKGEYNFYNSQGEILGKYEIFSSNMGNGLKKGKKFIIFDDEKYESNH